MSFKRVFISRFFPGAASLLERRALYTTPVLPFTPLFMAFSTRRSLHPSPPLQSVSLRQEIAAHRKKKSTDLRGPHCPRDIQQGKGGQEARDAGQSRGLAMAGTRERGESETGKGEATRFP